jgi:hypothetical protein
MASKRPYITVGWSELVALPDWGVHSLRAKIDTGARSTALHVDDLDIRNGLAIFRIHHGQEIRSPVVRIAHVRSSNGQADERIFVKTSLRLGSYQRQVELSLVDRGDMRFPMLVVRTALAGRYLVDPGKRRLTKPVLDDRPR